MANLKDIAKLSNVSIASVSRILNDDETFNATKETKDKVKEVARQLNYKVQVRKKKDNSNISNNSNEPKYNFGILQMYNSEALIDDPYYVKIESSLEALQVEYNFTVSKINNNHNNTFVNSTQNKLDGIFAIGIFSMAEIEALKELTPNFVFVDSAPSNKYYGILPNFHRAICESIKYFLDNGHKKIGYIGEEYILGGEYNLWNEYGKVFEPRRIYFESFLKPLGLFNQDFTIITKNNINSGYESTKKFLENHNDIPTAFFVSSDSCANGVIRAIIEAGYNIPNDISLIAFNNTILSESALVPLTSVAISSDQMATVAVRNMLELINKTGFPVKTSIQCGLVHRSSVATLN